MDNPWLCIVSPIPVHHHRIWYFPVMGVKRGVGLHVSKERGGFQEGGMKKERWVWG